MKSIVIFLFALLFLTACEKEIDINLDTTEPQVVIEGNINNQPGPYFVRLSKSVNFNEPNIYPGITNALVVIADNTGITDTLVETTPGLYRTNKTIGQSGVTYNLSIKAEGRSYLATSTMPQVVPLADIRFNAFARPGDDDGFITIPVYTDPLVPGNNYRFLFSVNGKLAESYNVFNDNVSNGLTNERPIFDQELDIKAGDSVKVEMRCIDLSTYNYFYTLSEISGGGPGGGVTPANPPNNITGDKALGYFSAHTSQTITKAAE